MRRSFLAAVAPLFLAGGLTAQAQEDAPPGMIAVSYYQCDFDQVEPIIEAWSTAFQQMENDGVVMGWGVLQHAWADEWNLIVYRVIPDLAGLQASMEAQGDALDAADPNLQEHMRAACNGQHKDNIYWIAASNNDPDDEGM
jgi:hypothetical protein